MGKKHINIICLIGADIIWGAAFVSQKVGGELVGAFSFNFVRFLIGAIVLAPIIFITDKNNTNKDNKSDKKLLIAGGILCGIALMIATNLQQIGLNEGATVGKAGFLTACYIVIVPFLSIFVGKKVNVLEISGVFIALIGLSFLCLNKEDMSVDKPDILLLLCALSFAVQIMIIDYYAARLNVVKLACVQFLTCGIISGIPMLIFEMKDISKWLNSFASSSAWIAILYAGIMSSGVAYTLQMRGQKNFNPSIASLIMSLESVFSVIFGVILLHERMATKEIIGSVMIFAAIIVAQIKVGGKDEKTSI